MIGLIIVLIVIGALLYIAQLLPIDETVKRIIYVVAVVAIVLYLLQFFLGGGGDIRLPH